MTGKSRTIVVVATAGCLLGWLTMNMPVSADSKGHFPRKGSYTAWINANVFYQKGVEWSGHGHPERAVDSFEKAIATYPFDSLYHYNLGVARTAAGDPARAEAPFRQAVELEPEYFPAWYNLGSLLVRLERPSEAKDAWKHALKIKGISDADRQSVEKLLENLGEPVRKGKKTHKEKKKKSPEKSRKPVTGKSNSSKPGTGIAPVEAGARERQTAVPDPHSSSKDDF